MRSFKLPPTITPHERARELNAYLWQKEISQHLPNSRVISEGKELFMLGGYSYLGLLADQEVKEAAKKAIDELGTGSSGTAALSGTSKYHNRVEKIISKMWNRDETVLYPTGYSANLAVVGALMMGGGEIFIDARAHRSLMDATDQVRAKTTTFKHNDMADLEKKLKDSQSARNRLILVDGVYSMDGSICPLPELVDLCHKYNAYLLVDECHAVGMLPPHGKGVEEYFGMPSGTIDFRIGTLSKAIPSMGGFASCSKEFGQFIRHNATHSIFSGAAAGATYAAAEVSIKKFLTNPDWISEMHRKAELFRGLMNEFGFDTGDSTTCIIPVIIKNTELCMKVAAKLFEKGIYIQPIIFPAVKESRLRVGISRTMSDEDLIWAANTIRETYEELTQE